MPEPNKPRTASRLFVSIVFLSALLVLLAFVAASSTSAAAHGAISSARAALLSDRPVDEHNPIIPGDHPDPTIVRIGKTYWTTSTSGDWAPEFSLYRSNDLHHWTAAGAVFPHTPAWAESDFWAPELVYDGGRVLVYYVARKRGGPLCIAAATASRPQGPYTDHGPIICQPDGSIDPSFVRDKQGRPYLIWKEDGNSIQKPTVIWAQPLTDDLLHLTGEKTQLLVNDPPSWEGGVVEAPYILRHADRFYLFYAGNACCGRECNYAEGVARADHLLGPWLKDPANPIIRPNGGWKCPGHGTAVETKKGEDYFLYHAYPMVGTIYLGRESVLDRITWTAEGWPQVNNGQGPGGALQDFSTTTRDINTRMEDDFKRAPLDPEWKWPIGHGPDVTLSHGKLTLAAPASGGQAFIARSPLAAAYTATVELMPQSTGAGGLAIIGNRENECLLVREGRHLELWQYEKDHKHILWRSEDLPARPLWLQAHFGGKAEATFSYSFDRQHWTGAGSAISLAALPSWDQGLRVGLVALGQPNSSASFAHFSLLAEQ